MEWKDWKGLTGSKMDLLSLPTLDASPSSRVPSGRLSRSSRAQTSSRSSDSSRLAIDFHRFRIEIFRTIVSNLDFNPNISYETEEDYFQSILLLKVDLDEMRMLHAEKQQAQLEQAKRKHPKLERTQRLRGTSVPESSSLRSPPIKKPKQSVIEKSKQNEKRCTSRLGTPSLSQHRLELERRLRFDTRRQKEEETRSIVLREIEDTLDDFHRRGTGIGVHDSIESFIRRSQSFINHRRVFIARDELERVYSLFALHQRSSSLLLDDAKTALMMANKRISVFRKLLFHPDFMELCTLMFEYICEKFVSPVEDVMKWQSRIDELLGDICYLTVRLNVTKGMKDHVMEHVKEMSIIMGYSIATCIVDHLPSPGNELLFPRWLFLHAAMKGKCRGENIHKLTCAKYLMEKLLIEMRFFVFQSNVEHVYETMVGEWLPYCRQLELIYSLFGDVISYSSFIDEIKLQVTECIIETLSSSLRAHEERILKTDSAWKSSAAIRPSVLRILCCSSHSFAYFEHFSRVQESLEDSSQSLDQHLRTDSSRGMDDKSTTITKQQERLSPHIQISHPESSSFYAKTEDNSTEEDGNSYSSHVRQCTFRIRKISPFADRLAKIPRSYSQDFSTRRKVFDLARMSPIMQQFLSRDRLETGEQAQRAILIHTHSPDTIVHIPSLTGKVEIVEDISRKMESLVDSYEKAKRSFLCEQIEEGKKLGEFYELLRLRESATIEKLRLRADRRRRETSAFSAAIGVPTRNSFGGRTVGSTRLRSRSLSPMSCSVSKDSTVEETSPSLSPISKKQARFLQGDISAPLKLASSTSSTSAKLDQENTSLKGRESIPLRRCPSLSELHAQIVHRNSLRHRDRVSESREISSSAFSSDGSAINKGVSPSSMEAIVVNDSDSEDELESEISEKDRSSSVQMFSSLMISPTMLAKSKQPRRDVSPLSKTTSPLHRLQRLESFTGMEDYDLERQRRRNLGRVKVIHRNMS